ncbi:hypothetical protein FHETE_1328 [Fusarium heterosporum]|uniref:Uncharacterized protein n=1 Tax=Fusarium heterosporum TaxID=42747 RepID=A0A8H5TU11_FUSHE|nr:hypothetical protein FHETE_1328 [Fusarium heterosporum]
MALRTLSQKILATSVVAAVTTAGVYGFTVRKRVSIVDRNSITRSQTVPSTFEQSKSVGEIVNAKKHMHHSDWRFITLDIPAQHRDVPDEVLLAKFVKGFFGGAVLRPERLTLQTLGIKLVSFSKAAQTTVLWSLNDIPESRLLPVNSVLFGVFQVLDSKIADNNIKHVPKETESYVDFAFGSDETVFAGVHRFSVVRSQKENQEETVQIHFQHITCNPTVNKPLGPQWMLGFHELYADYLFRDGVGEIKRWMNQSR